MSDHDRLIDRYIACWNEADAGRRAALVAETFAAEASYRDPMMQGEGQPGIAAMIGAAQAQFPGLRFSRRGTVDRHNGHLRFAWSLGVPGAAPAAAGTDFATLAPDGRLASVTGFLDAVREAA
ncbi:MAG: nuclear transport factor 2 family protein [Acetobacteraceae bacterium]|nr:MAG: nuclear transport factor 2 family protein [Acetobacteraceae bacterium]